MTSKGTFWIAQLQTHHFSFTAIGATEVKARGAMARGWRRHTEEYTIL